MQLDSRGFLRKNKFLHSSEKMVPGKDFEITCTSFRRKEEILQLAANNCLPFIHFLFIFALSQDDSMKKNILLNVYFWPPHINLDDPPSLSQHTADQAITSARSTRLGDDYSYEDSGSCVSGEEEGGFV